MGRKRNLLISAGCFALGFGTTAARANLVVDPGFESGGAGWTFIGNAGPDDHDGTHSGAWTAFVNAGGLVSMPPDSGSVSQDISTITGHSYSIDMWVGQNAEAGPPDEILISFGSSTLFDQIGPIFNTTSVPEGSGPAPSAYTELSFTATAAGPTSTFEYEGLNLVGGTYFIDDVSINDLGGIPTPEPGTLGLLLAALAGFSPLMRRRPPRA